jgi:hypothetical protein
MGLFKRSSGGDQAPATSALTPQAEKLKAIGYGGLVETLTSPESKQRLKSLWETIDAMAAEAGAAPRRLFAGISGDGSRYFEVHQPDPGAERYVVMAATVGTEADSGPQFYDAQAEHYRGDPPLRVHFRDPAASGTQCQLGIREVSQASANTSSYQIGLDPSNSSPVFPMARMQADLGWPANELRVSTYDPSGDQTQALRINLPSQPAPPVDQDDLAL